MSEKKNKATTKRQKKLAKIVVNAALRPNEAPHNVSALEALAAAENYLEQGDYGSCGQVCAQLINGGKLFVEPYALMLRVAVEMGRVREALDIAEKLLAHGVTDANDIIVLGHALLQCNRHERALPLLDDAIKRHPGDYRIRDLRAVAYADMGDQQRAADELRMVIKMSPRRFGAYRVLATLGDLNDAEMSALQKAKPADAKERAYVDYALAYAYRRRGDTNKEIDHLNAANAQMKDIFDYAHDDEVVRSDQLIEWVDAEWIDQFKAPPTGNNRPIFVVGMPRSGSTLVEQILTSHPDVGTAGETALFECTLLDVVRKRYPGTNWPDIVQKLTSNDIGYLSDEYRAGIREVFTDRPVFVDKTLGYYRYVGLLAAALPDAVFVHTLRHPMATCLSCFQQPLDDIDFTASIDNIALRYVDHVRVMDHWKQLLGDRIITMQYEHLVDDFETEARRLLAACRLPWDDAVLKFHERERLVRTASWTQVRQPIYRSSVDSWRQYEALLAPAREIVEPALGAG